MSGVITLSRSHIVPFLTFSERRDLREQAWRAWTSRGEHPGASDNRGVAAEILQLRLEQARLHGYASYADYALADTMAGSQAAVTALLEQVWKPAQGARRGRARGARGAGALARRAGGDRALGLALLRREGAPGALRSRRSRDQAVLLARGHGRRRIRLRRAPVRPALRRAAADPRLPPGRQGLRGARRRRRGDRRLPARQLRAADQAQRRLDERLPHAVEERRRRRRRRCCRSSSTTTTSPRARRASRRCSASTTRARCSTSSATACTGCSRTSPTSASRAPTCCAISSSCRRSCSSTGSRSPRC